MVNLLASKSKILPIGLAIIHKAHTPDSYLFIRRKNEPYKGYWGLVGGKLEEHEHILDGILREVSEETMVENLKMLGFAGIVSEHLVSGKDLLVNFLIFVAHVVIDGEISFDTREGELRWFSRDEIKARKDEFIPSDWNMFFKFNRPIENAYFDALIEKLGDKYVLEYFE